ERRRHRGFVERAERGEALDEIAVFVASSAGNPGRARHLGGGAAAESIGVMSSKRRVKREQAAFVGIQRLPAGPGPQEATNHAVAAVVGGGRLYMEGERKAVS